MPRISQTVERDRAVTFRLEGRVVGPWVAELREACRRVLEEKRGLTLDLSEVMFASRAAVTLLLELKAQGVVLSGCSPLLSQTLKSAEV
jgi:hypothetical protein